MALLKIDVYIVRG